MESQKKSSKPNNTTILRISTEKTPDYEENQESEEETYSMRVFVSEEDRDNICSNLMKKVQLSKPEFAEIQDMPGLVDHITFQSVGDTLMHLGCRSRYFCSIDKNWKLTKLAQGLGEDVFSSIFHKGYWFIFPDGREVEIHRPTGKEVQPLELVKKLEHSFRGRYCQRVNSNRNTQIVDDTIYFLDNRPHLFAIDTSKAPDFPVKMFEPTAVADFYVSPNRNSIVTLGLKGEILRDGIQIVDLKSPDIEEFTCLLVSKIGYLAVSTNEAVRKNYLDLVWKCTDVRKRLELPWLHSPEHDSRAEMVNNIIELKLRNCPFFMMKRLSRFVDVVTVLRKELVSVVSVDIYTTGKMNEPYLFCLTK